MRRVRLFSEVPSNRAKAKGTDKHRKLHRNMKKNIFTLRVTELWKRLPREVVVSFSGDNKTRLDNFLCNLL